jgi:hypothetical protein
MTELIVRGRQGGKTTDLIRRSAGTGAYIVAADQRHAEYIARQARDLGMRPPPRMTASEWLARSYYGPGVPGLLLDDLDRIIAAMSHVPVLAATWTETVGERADG